MLERVRVKNVTVTSARGGAITYSERSPSELIIADSVVSGQGIYVSRLSGSLVVLNKVLKGNSPCAIKIGGAKRTARLVVRNCSIEGNKPHAVVERADKGAVLDLNDNWWGDPAGPHHEKLNPLGRGDAILLGPKVYAGAVKLERCLPRPGGEPVKLSEVVKSVTPKTTTGLAATTTKTTPTRTAYPTTTPTETPVTPKASPITPPASPKTTPPAAQLPTHYVLLALLILLVLAVLLVRRRP